jgi:hypothetical protein
MDVTSHFIYEVFVDQAVAVIVLVVADLRQGRLAVTEARFAAYLDACTLVSIAPVDETGHLQAECLRIASAVATNGDTDGWQILSWTDAFRAFWALVHSAPLHASPIVQ